MLMHKAKASREFFVVFRNMNTEDVPVVTNYLKHYTENDCGLVCHKKFYLKKKSNLKNLTLECFIAFCRVKESQAMAKEQQTIKHLWDCLFVKPLWEIVVDVCGFEISFDRILGTGDCNGYDHVLTLISFLTYKEWLLLSLEGKKNNKVLNIASTRVWKYLNATHHSDHLHRCVISTLKYHEEEKD